MAHAFDPSVWEAEAGGFLCVQGLLSLHREFQAAGVIYRDPLLKTKNNKKINYIDTSYSYKSLFSFFRFVSTFYS